MVLFTKTYEVDPRVADDGKCASILNSHLTLRNDYFFKYCKIGRAGAPGTELWNILQTVNKLSAEYKSCFSKYVVDDDIISEEDRTYKPTIGIIRDRDSFVSVLSGVRKRYIDAEMDQEHRDLAQACNALMNDIKVNRPGLITTSGLTGCRI